MIKRILIFISILLSFSLSDEKIQFIFFNSIDGESIKNKKNTEIEYRILNGKNDTDQEFQEMKNARSFGFSKTENYF